MADIHGAEERHFAGTMTRMVIEHFRDDPTGASVATLLDLAGEHRDVSILMDDASWSSYGQIRALLQAAAHLLGGTERLADIGTHAAISPGSMPDITGAIQDLGSPDAIFVQIGSGQNGVSPLMETETEQRGPGHWIIRSRLPAGFEPFPELCWFNVGIDRLLPALFGFAEIETVEETCVRRGDEWCTVAVRWYDTDSLARTVSFLESKLQVSGSRLEAFQRIVAELVSADDLDTMLTRVVASAARAARASAFVLALDSVSSSGRSVYSEGVDTVEAAEIAARVLALDDPNTMTGGLAVDVVSTRQRYGRLVALDRSGSITMIHDRTLLEAYARLVATALDSATALAEARRQASTAHALLNLSSTLADIATTEEMASKIAQAIPLVIDCDRALVVMIDSEAGVARLGASQGFDSPYISTGMGLPVVVEGWIANLHYHDLATARGPIHAFMRAHGLVAMVSLPVMVDGAAVGILTAAVTHEPERLQLSADLEERLRGLAGQASTALRNAALIETIRHQALHDSLTGLPNRTLLLDRAEQMLARSRRNGSASAALYIDLDDFKDVNDVYGHAAGDQLLCAVAERLRATLRADDTVGRLGGDEFVVLAEGESLADGVGHIAARLLDVLGEPYHLAAAAHHPVQVTASIGFVDGDRKTASELLRDADLALYCSKSDGKNRFAAFVPKMQTALLDRLQMEDNLRRALAGGEFFLLYQPTFALADRSITGVEALIRWHQPVDGIVMPDTFIPTLEASGMIVDVGRWVIHEACQQAAAWTLQGHPMDISVNVSARQFEHESFVDDVRLALARSGLDSAALTLEITETTMMRDPARTLEILTEMQRLGVGLAVDDFGTGYSSLAYLHQFPIDTIKIDRSFIRGLSESPESRALVRTLVQLGKTLGLRTLAKGIETLDQLAVLRREQCDGGQGFLVAPPLQPDEVATMFAALFDTGGHVPGSTRMPVDGVHAGG